MTPEERREARRAKILQRSQVSEDQFASALINNNISELVSKPESISSPSPNEYQPNASHYVQAEAQNLIGGKQEASQSESTFDIIKYVKSKQQAHHIQKLKMFAMILLGLVSSLFVFNAKFEHSNLFLIFVIVDLSINIMFFGQKVQVDRDKFSPALSGFITVVEKLVG